MQKYRTFNKQMGVQGELLTTTPQLAWRHPAKASLELPQHPRPPRPGSRSPIGSTLAAIVITIKEPCATRTRITPPVRRIGSARRFAKRITTTLVPRPGASATAPAQRQAKTRFHRRGIAMHPVEGAVMERFAGEVGF